jgi:predicted ATPase
MKYTKFIIKNFKGITDLTIDLKRRPETKVLTFVGLNESGKTTILEAIKSLCDPPDENSLHKFIPKNKKLNFNDTISITAELDFSEEDERYFNDVARTQGFKFFADIKHIKVSRYFTFRNSNYIKADNFTVEAEISGSKKVPNKLKPLGGDDLSHIVHKIQHRLPPIIFYQDFLFDFPERIYLEFPEGEDDLEYEKSYKEVFEDILVTIDSSLNVDTHIVERMHSSKRSDSEALDATLDKLGAKITKRIFGAWEQLFSSKGKEILIKGRLDDDDRAYIELKVKENSEQYHISERSLGFKWFFTFLLFTEFRKNRKDDLGEILFLLDEPASNLHSTAQKKLLNTFEQIIDKSSLMYTTHSHHLINPNWLSGAYIVRNKNLNYNEDSNFISDNTDVEAIPYNQFVSKYPDQQDYFQPILDTIEYQPGLLEKIPSICITEGKTDFYILNYFNRVITTKKYPIGFYPGNGANSNFQIVRLYMAWGRKFYILLDGDIPGIEAKQEYLKEFGEVIAENIFTLADIHHSFNGSIETIFSESDKLTITKLFDSSLTEFKKSAFNSKIQEAFIKEEKISISSVTVKRFNQILEFLNDKCTQTTKK